MYHIYSNTSLQWRSYRWGSGGGVVALPWLNPSIKKVLIFLMWKAFFGWKSSNFIILAPPPRTFPPPGKFPRYATTSLPTLFSRVGGKSPIFTRTTLPRTIFKGWEDKSIIFARIWASLLYFQRGGGKSTILTQIQPFLEFLLKEGRIRVPYFFYIKTSLHTNFFTRCLII